MIGLIKALQQRTALGWLQLKHDKTRLLAAIAGIAFADLLIFMQLGFMSALYEANTQYPRRLLADLVLISVQAEGISQLYTLPRRRLYQAMDIPGVESVDALYVGSVSWRNPQNRDKASMSVFGQDPARPTFALPEVNQQLDQIKLTDTVLFDRASRGSSQELIDSIDQGDSVTTEIDRLTLTVGGTYELGASFADDGAIITSDQTFLRLFPKRDAGTVSMGLIDLEPGYDPETVKAALNEYLPDDVQVMTYDEYVDFEINQISSDSPIGYVFGLGSAVGFMVGVVIVYQVLSTDVNAHLAEYATFKAMGYRTQYLLGVVFEEAIILSVLGFLPGFGISIGLYHLTASATALPIAMPIGRAVWVFGATVLMCGLSGAIATNRLRSADPADIF